MRGYLILAALVVMTYLTGCNNSIGDYMASSSISEDGFAKDEQQIRELHGQEVKVWGFVDHSNLYGDEDAKEILEDWWSGYGPDSSIWRFNLKRHLLAPMPVLVLLYASREECNKLTRWLRTDK